MKEKIVNIFQKVFGLIIILMIVFSFILISALLFYYSTTYFQWYGIMEFFADKTYFKTTREMAIDASINFAFINILLTISIQVILEFVYKKNNRRK